MKRNIILVILVLALAALLCACGEAQRTVLFYANGQLASEVTVAANEAPVPPSAHVTGYALIGWFEEGSDTPYDFSQNPGRDLILTAKYKSVITDEETFYPIPIKEDELNADYQLFDKFGKVLSAAPVEDGVYIVAEGYAQHGYYGYYKTEEEPSASMAVGVFISPRGVITRAVLVDSFAQGAGYAAKITPEYMDASYKDKPSLSTITAEPVTGATGTSNEVMYAVQAAAYYADKVYGYAADTGDQDRAEIETAYPATYTTINTDYKPDEKNFGEVIYAAEGTTADGNQVVAMKVKSAKKFNYAGFAPTGWGSSEPSPYTMIIVVDKATNKVVFWKVLVDGTKKPEYFTVPDEKIDAYKTVEITSETVFDNFRDGLVLDLDVQLSPSSEGTVITGTSIVYTGTSEDGTLSGQLVRLCFATAARFYKNY